MTFPARGPISSPKELVVPEVLNNGQQLVRKVAAVSAVRNNWTREEIAVIYHEPLMELVHQAVRQYLHLHISSPTLVSALDQFLPQPYINIKSFIYLKNH